MNLNSFTVTATLSILAATAFADNLPSRVPLPNPILRIETGHHTAVVRRIAVDESNRWLATASDDKTLRIWNLSTGTLARTIRPPIGEGKEGQLYSVAVSPDGSRIAAGGWTGTSLDGTTSVYLFDRDSGQMIASVPGLPDTVNELAWSPNGHFLAIGLAGRGGVRVINADTFAPVGGDSDFRNSINGLDFDHAGHLAATSLDGELRLYSVSDSGIAKSRKQTVPGGDRPLGVRFSPDGRYLAVGFMDVPKVTVLLSETFAFAFSPDMSGLKPSDPVPHVAWSQDGETLFAAGSADVDNGAHYIIRAWAQYGGGSYSNLPASTHSIFDLRALKNDSLAYADDSGAWGVFDKRGRQIHFTSASAADFRSGRRSFKLSPNGMIVQIGLDRGGSSLFRFNMTELRTEPVKSDNTLSEPVTGVVGLQVENWNGSFRPTLNGRSLKMDIGERAESVSFDVEHRSIVLGTSWGLHRYDSSGHEVWKSITAATAWSINVSDDGRWVVAALSDGTLRWHRMTDGQEVVALYPHSDRTRWVVWSPAGFFDASPGADDLIGWHVNRGKTESADFFPASRLRTQFNRPDLLATLLQAPEGDAIFSSSNQSADATAERIPIPQGASHNLLPPMIEILSPTDLRTSRDTVLLRYRTRSPDNAPVLGLRARINGLLVSVPKARNLEVTDTRGGIQELTLSVPTENSEIQLFAENRNGVSPAATVRVIWEGKPSARDPDRLMRPKLYVVAVGVSHYANPDYNLNLAAKDAKDFADVMQKQRGQLYSDVRTHLLTDKMATKDAVLAGLEWLKKQVTSRDVGILFMAGHGINDSTGNYYFLPHNGDPMNLLRTGVAQSDIKLALNTIAGKALFFIDSCHSGNALGTSRTRRLDNGINAFANELASAENGVVVYAAATGRQSSIENPEWGNGAFTKAVVEGLSGKADFQKVGRVTHKALDFYVAERVKELTGGQQSPVSITPAGVADFPISIVLH